MPELPEVETVRRTLDAATRGLCVGEVRSSGKGLHGGSAVPRAAIARALGGRVVTGWERRGKYLIGRFAGAPHALLVHLGMSGRLVVEPEVSTAPKHTHFEVALTRPALGAGAVGKRGARVADAADAVDAAKAGRAKPATPIRGASAEVHLRFVDPRRFGVVRLLDVHALEEQAPLASLGPEPLGRGFHARYLHAELAGSRRPIKVALLDQGLVAGVGNIYASEALFDARVDPRRASGSLTGDDCADLARSIKRVLRAAIRASGTTFSDYRDGLGRRGGFQSRLTVFGRTGEPCRACGGVVTRLVQAGRSTFACLRCQR